MYINLRSSVTHEIGNNICDVIKWNELDVRNIDFELQAKVGDKCACFILFKELFISLQCPIEMEFGPKCSHSKCLSELN